MKNKQKGVTLIEMILVVALIAVMTILAFLQKQLEMEQVRARAVGVDLYIYNNAVRNWLSENISTTPLNVTRNGTTWLKPNSCGGSSGRVDGYLPCTFPDATAANPMKFSNMALTTVLTRTFTPSGDVQTTGVTTTTPFRLSANGIPSKLRADLSGLAAITAASGVISAAQMTPNMATTDGTYRSDPITAIITMEASNRANADAWLRTDGGNSMNNNLKFTSTLANSLRQVMGVSRIQSNSNTDTLFIGNQNNSTTMPVNGGGSATPLDVSAADRESVVVDANARIYGKLRTNDAITALSGNVTASTGSVVAGVDVRAGRDVIATNNSYGRTFYDQDNTAFYVDPASVSIVNRVNMNTLSSQNPATPLQVVGNQVSFNNWTAGNDVTLSGRVNTNNLFIRKNGKSIPLTNLLPNYVLYQSYFAMHGQTVPTPACAAGGSPKIFVMPQTVPTNTARPVSGYSTAPVGATFFYAVTIAGGWRVIAQTWSGAFDGEGTAIVSTYCLY